MRCSRYLWFFTIFMVGFPIFYLLFAAFIFDLGSKGILSILLSPMFYLASVFWVITGFGLRELKHWGWYTFIGAQFFITYLNALNLVNYSDSSSKGMAFALTVLIQLYVFLTVANEVRVPYLFPRIKWWESGLAAMHHVPVEMFHVGSATGTSMGQLLDVNTRGCFIKCPADFGSLEKITIRVEAYGLSVDVPGRVMWNAVSAVTHPKGIGVQFYALDRSHKRKLRRIIRHFNQEKNQVDVIETV
jgi:hypothetical protein